MKSLSLYKKYYSVNTLHDVVKTFQDTLLESNKTFSYFVDWQKIKENVERYNYEINLLNYLVGQKDTGQKLKEILNKNPEVLPVIPLIIAVRDNDISVITDANKPLETLKKYDFKKRALTDRDIEDITLFCEKAGILSLFSSFRIKDLRDYLLGVETGLDTNARKNRSGTAMETLIEPSLNQIKGIIVFKQKTFGYLADSENVKISEGLKDRKFDFVVKAKNRFFNIEVNFYSGGGSKPQEIVDSYINRNHELCQEGWGFVWITDGLGWKVCTNQMTKAFKDMDYVLNVDFVKKGILRDILLST